ncbi:uncharacterized protein J4E79_010295 [Alternaria viburni]|uniref:uncharacterized protein n=1 Tax=Alternaria viburni TaxID=566460 RepID=UPI0020C527D0|nr:uncharacterized protein J4E79_010295 [Alternaria viburni]KAI4647437.1 hypothetical protein J4E79_010295 [Alternaria viburni]
MPSQDTPILDTHIHLWPSTATSSSNHGWMTPGHHLSKRHGISDYLSITSPQPAGFIYVETDRYLSSAEPSISGSDSDEDVKGKLREWAKEPLEEVRFLRRIVEGTPEGGDGFTGEESGKMKGAVVYAPFHLKPRVFDVYLEIVREVAGPQLWKCIKGWRYLLQRKGEGVVAKMLKEDEESWVSNLVGLKGLGDGCQAWCFDVGVDNHRDGTGPMEAVGGLIKAVRTREEKEGDGDGKKVKFVLNHLAKPPLSPISPSPSPIWLQAMSSLSSDTNVYMKFSGAFNEFTVEPTPADIASILTVLSPFLDHVFKQSHVRE